MVGYIKFSMPMISSAQNQNCMLDAVHCIWKKKSTVQGRKTNTKHSEANGSVAPVLHPITLAFSGSHGPLEDDFLVYYSQSALPQIRLSILLGIVVFAIFGILDATLIPEGKNVAWFIRYAIVCPTALFVLLMTYTRYYERLMQALLSVLVLTGGLGIVAMITIVPPPANLYYDSGIILVFLYGYTFIRMRFVWATLTCMSIVAGYEFSCIFIKPIPAVEMISNNFFLLGGNLIGMFACYCIEYYTRRDFFMARQLEQEQEKVSAVNRQLEERVNERTQQLVKANESLRNEMKMSQRAEREKLDLQLQLQQAQKMEAVGTLAGGIAHDFNNILAAIMGYTEISLLQNQADNDLKENLDKILQASQRAKELVNQILAFSRQQPLDIQVLRLKPIVREVLALLRASLPRTIDIGERIAPDLYTIQADPTQIHQVLMNLCTNAAHAMEENGGRLDVSLENIYLDQDNRLRMWTVSPGWFVRISVEDNGCGIDPEISERIFDPYFTTKQLGKGTGMGLAVTHGIVKSAGGAITVESQLGRGTRFDVYLPGYTEEENETGESIKSLPLGKERILFIDDEENLVDIMRDLLQRLGYRVAVTRHPLDALDWFREDPSRFDLVITDAEMPQMTGDRLARELLAIRKDLPIIMCTGFSEKINRENIKAMGVRHLLMKPIAFRNLAEVIREVLDVSKDSFIACQ
jgi:signal transduction histidine kinase/ActR/RegA family two-component response regulator